MAESDRSRSPVPGRSRADPGAAAQQVRQELPFFPRWCGPMQSAIWQSQRMPRPQFRPQYRPQFNMPQSGPYVGNPSMSQSPTSQSGIWPSPRFPPAPPSSPPPTLAYPFPSRPSTPPCSPTLPCPPTEVASPSTPSIFHHPSLVKLAPLMSIHLGVKQRLMTAAPMALIPILIGKRTKTITIIRKSMA